VPGTGGLAESGNDAEKSRVKSTTCAVEWLLDLGSNQGPTD
jgi:hypothetical protein